MFEQHQYSSEPLQRVLITGHGSAAGLGSWSRLTVSRLSASPTERRAQVSVASQLLHLPVGGQRAAWASGSCGKRHVGTNAAPSVSQR